MPVLIQIGDVLFDTGPQTSDVIEGDLRLLSSVSQPITYQ
jgi:hypothetical protein